LALPFPEGGGFLLPSPNCPAGLLFMAAMPSEEAVASRAVLAAKKRYLSVPSVERWW